MACDLEKSLQRFGGIGGLVVELLAALRKRRSFDWSRRRERLLVGLFLMTLVLIPNVAVSANWVKLSAFYDEGKKNSVAANIYLDRESLVVKGNIASALTMVDYVKTQTWSHGRKYMSNIHRVEYDCLKREERLLEVTFFSQRMGKGTAWKDEESDRRRADNKSRWLRPSRDELLEFACAAEGRPK